MKLKIANGTAIEGHGIAVECGVLKLYGEPEGKGVNCLKPVLLAYCLHPGESVRRVNTEGDYEVNQ